MNFAGKKPLPRMTAAEFLEWDGGGLVGKLELVEGEVVAMSPASGTHALIQANIAFLLGAHLRAKKLPCRVGTEAPIIPRLHANDNVRAPDLAVTCIAAPPGKTFPDPVLIVEVSSPSNQDETWNSIRACATIPTLAEILVVDSDRQKARIFRKSDKGEWPIDPEVVEAEGAVKLTSIDAAFEMREIYSGTELEV